MKENVKSWLIPLLFTLVGTLAGLAYYHFVGCSTGSCAITSSPVRSMVYMGLMGWLLSGVFNGGCAGGCDI